jgi:hypothetical protein
MKHFTIYAATMIFLSGVSLLLTGCGDAPNSKAKTTQASTPSVGRDYGETLHGAITQAHEVRRTLEHSSLTPGQADESAE